MGTVVAEEGEVSGGTEAERVELRGHRGQAVDEVEVVAEGSSQQPAQLARAALEIRGAALATAVYISAASVVPAPTGAVEAAVHVVQVLAAASVAAVGAVAVVEAGGREVDATPVLVDLGLHALLLGHVGELLAM